MSQKNTTAIIGIIVTAIIGAGTLFIMWRTFDLQKKQLQSELNQTVRERNKAREVARKYKKYLKQIEDAPSKFTDTLGQLIEDASYEVNRKEGESKLIPAARALVATRNGFRSNLESIGKRLDSEIDQLEQELLKEPPDPAKIKEIIEVLKRKWPGKKKEIDLTVHKLMTELGLTEQQ